MYQRYAKSLPIAETLFFIFLVALHLLPLWWPAHFFTVDGGGHVYNAAVIKDITGNPQRTYAEFYQINFFPSPNWITQPFLMAFAVFTDAESAERLMWSIILCSMAFGWRYYLKGLRIGHFKIFSYLIFPFLYHQTLFLGFLNYEASIAVFLFTLAFYHRWKRDGKRLYLTLVTVFCTLLYFSHLVGIFVFSLYVAVYELSQCFIRDGFSIRRIPFKNLALVFALPYLLLLFYLARDSESDGLAWLPLDIWIQRISVLDSLTCFRETEWSYLRWFVYIPLSAIIIDLLIGFIQSERRTTTVPIRSLAVFVLLLLLASILLPDASSGGGGYLVVRLTFIALLFFCLLVFFIVKNPWIQRIAVMTLLVVQTDRLFYLVRTEIQRSTQLDAIHKCSDLIQPGSFLTTVEWDLNWPLSHYPELIAADKKLICLNSLGAHKIFSPVVWKEEWRRNESISCWAGNPWSCAPQGLQLITQGYRSYILVNGQCLLSEDHCTVWQKFLHESCRSVWNDGGELFLYEVIE